MKNLLCLAVFFCSFSNLLAQADSVAVDATICQGEIYLFDNLELTTPGIYTAVFQNQSGADSIVTLTLIVHPTDSVEILLELCEEEASPLTGIVYLFEGDFTEQLVLSNQHGCDSVVTAQIIVHPEEFGEGWQMVPYGYIALDGTVVTEPTWEVTYDTTEFGCLYIIAILLIPFPNAANELEETTNFQIFPNPFQDEIRLKFNLPERMAISASVLDGSGLQVTVLIENEAMSAGEHELIFPQKDLPPGFYLLHFQADGKSLLKKLVKW
ncbi:MAG: T9SS type A sorting domain-containing protein [Bacteroidetes bacterium]|nr:T9SS type A sorting domain-containing protein [Bacteroidota bacterium]